MQEKIADIDWQQTVIEEMNEKGYALVSQFLPVQSCDELIGKYDKSDLYRKTITMERHSFGSPVQIRRQHLARLDDYSFR